MFLDSPGFKINRSREFRIFDSTFQESNAIQTQQLQQILYSTQVSLLYICDMEEKIKALREWMIKKGCIIHPNLEIPCNINGIQGIGTKATILHRTLIMAIPSSLILTVTRCYNDPLVKKLFQANDDLFDYESSEDCQFNVLCVFMMYHKLHLAESEWKQYIETIAEPQTAIDWKNRQLKGLNKSIIEEIIHIRRECLQLENNLIAYLLTRKQFNGVGKEQLRKLFTQCYRTVMTRCFGYYFSETCLIPVADLINHGCEVVNHQLINLNYQTQKQFKEGYTTRKDQIDCSLLNLQKPQTLHLPFRQKFLVQSHIIEQSEDYERIASLNRNKIDQHLYSWNEQRLQKQTGNLEELHFCSEDQEEDNDTDEQFQAEQVREMQNCKQNEQEQMAQFMKHYVKVQNYANVQKRLEDIKKQAHERVDKKIQQIVNNIAMKTDNQSPSLNQDIQQQIRSLKKLKQLHTLSEHETIEDRKNIIAHALAVNSITAEGKDQKSQTIPPNPSGQKIQQQPVVMINKRDNVPIQMVDSDSESSQNEDVWGLQEGAYFTMSTSSAVSANTQLYNSYGSRTNKFLLVWYGFTYENNLHDSVSFRLQVQFGALRPAHEIVLDTYIGGQGLSFKKNENQIVKDTEVSRQFRFKRNNISENLLIFLRLYLMNYYKGEDLYKLFVTFPTSVNYELFVFKYYRDILISLYSRYPLQVIQQLKKEYQLPEFQSIKYKIKFKIIYLQEQRKLLDKNMRAADQIIKILQFCTEKGGVISKSMYLNVPIQIIRMIRKYLISYEKSMPYILYQQKPQMEQAVKHEDSLDIQTREEQQDQWEQQCDIEQEEPSKQQQPIIQS